MLVRSFFLFFLSITNLLSQNLVKNNFFEDNSKKTIHKPLKNQTPLFPKDWNILNGKPDYFNTEHSTYYGYPIIKPIERGGKIGIEMYNKTNEVEGIYTELKTPLIAGKVYEISFSVAHCQYSDFVVNQFPFIFSKEKVSAHQVMNDTGTVVNILQLDHYITFHDKWVRVRGNYKASGGEKYLTLTNTRFRYTDKKHISMVKFKGESTKLNKEMDDVAYYFFDDIEVFPLEDTASYCNVVREESITNSATKEKINNLKEKGIIDRSSPIEFEKFKEYTHHIFLFDISNSMVNELENSKRIFKEFYDKMPENDIVTGIIFESYSHYLFERKAKSNALLAQVNHLNVSGGTEVKTGIDLVNKSLRADEKTNFYMITDVDNITTDSYLKQYVYLKLSFTNSHHLLSQYKYPVGEVDTVIFDQLFNENAINTLPKKIPNLRLFESKFNREIREFMESDHVNHENSTLVFISDCRFSDQKDSSSISYQIRPSNYVFLVDASSSMGDENKYELLKSSVMLFTQKLEPQNRISLISFSNKTKLILDRENSRERDLLKTSLNKIPLKGTTNFNEGLTYAYKHYKLNNAQQKVNLILFTDGLFSISDKVKRLIKTNKHISLEVYQFGNKPNKELLELQSANELRYNLVNKHQEVIEIQKNTVEQHSDATNIYSDKISRRVILSKLNIFGPSDISDID